MILAAGLGTRLRPLTEKMPKCLMPLAGRPLLDWTLRWVGRCGVTQCVINLHYLAEQVQAFVGDGKQYGLHAEYSFEPELMGTAGAVRKVSAFFDEPFFVIYSDNFSQWDLGILKSLHEEKASVATIAVHWRKDVTQSGMIEFDEEGRITRLVEKPKAEDVTSHYVSAGFFYLHPKVFDYIPDSGFCDFGFHVFPAMLRAGERIDAVKMEEPIIGIDTLEAYEEANAWAEKLKR
ncbi:MAG: mannose-phosphate guanylyltransferase [Thermodesulfobacteriota bacterium]|nr:mannose-phosphate guanylyltransferase [Thermodesulfobacteriota bacterium]